MNKILNNSHAHNYLRFINKIPKWELLAVVLENPKQWRIKMCQIVRNRTILLLQVTAPIKWIIFLQLMLI